MELRTLCQHPADISKVESLCLEYLRKRRAICEKFRQKDDKYETWGIYLGGLKYFDSTPRKIVFEYGEFEKGGVIIYFDDYENFNEKEFIAEMARKRLSQVQKRFNDLSEHYKAKIDKLQALIKVC